MSKNHRKYNSEETRKKMGESKKGNQYNLGRKLTEEHKRKIGQANLGKQRSQEVKERLRQFHLGKHHSKEAKQKMSISNKREKHPNWQGGISFLPYSVEFTKELKQFIKDRDGNECQNPYCDYKSKILAVHHINYNKQDCSQFNLITLCTSCNSKANFNKREWKRFYKRIIWSKY